MCALVVAGCGGGSAAKKTSVKKWVSTYCGAFATWEQSVQSDSVKFQTLLNGLRASGNKDVTKIRAQMSAIFARLVTESEKLGDKVKAAGTPDMKSGDKLKNGAVSAFSRLATEFGKEKQIIAKLPTTNPRDFTTRVSAISDSVGSSIATLGNAIRNLDKYKTAEFKKAENNDLTCQNL
ncbi:MAG: hypothetical protein ABSC51_05350 [Gaiellaceae bacterium]